jgi:hypothetical protein
MNLRWLFAAVLLLTTSAAPPLAAAPAEAAPSAAAATDAGPHRADDDSFLFSSQALGLIEAARAGEQLAAVPVVRGPDRAGRQSPPRRDPLSRAGRLADLAERPELHAPGTPAGDRHPAGDR